MSRARPFVRGFNYWIGMFTWYRQDEGWWETDPSYGPGWPENDYGWQVHNLDGWYLTQGGREIHLADSKGAARIGVKDALRLAAKAIREIHELTEAK